MRLEICSPLAGDSAGGRGAFTLIELLTVMAIILILAGLILSIAGNANYKASQSRAQGEIQALSTALESYKTDNGAYARITAANSGSNCYTTDTLNPAKDFDPAGATQKGVTYSNTSETLYQLLSGWFYIDPTTNKTAVATSTTTTPHPKYYTFKDAQLTTTPVTAPGSALDPSKVTAFNDPFGLSYGYSTIYQAEAESPTAIPSQTPADGYNPTYDLWSTAGYSNTSGKSYPTVITSAGTQNSLWVKNWQ